MKLTIVNLKKTAAAAMLAAGMMLAVPAATLAQVPRYAAGCGRYGHDRYRCPVVVVPSYRAGVYPGYGYAPVYAYPPAYTYGPAPVLRLHRDFDRDFDRGRRGYGR